ncbi:MAG: helix-turn-helix transcriptional regulator [Nitrospirae bacterium]|nr:helix-turn-helix transcriptional regulator [Nitrospirota bacterium]
MTKLRKQFGARIYELRIKAGLTQWQLAEKADLSNDTISRIERGQRSPSFEVLEKLAQALNVEVKELFNFSNRKFLKNKCQRELVDLLNYLEDKKPKDIDLIFQIARLIFEQTKH